MCFFFSLMPASIFATIGYFVCLSARKAEGGIRKLGQILTIWFFIIALLIPLGGAYLTITDNCPIGKECPMLEMMENMQSPVKK